MKSLYFVAGAIFALGVSAANAADMPVKAPAAPVAYAAPVYNWSGLYIGAHGGWGDAKFGGVFDNAGSAHQWSSNDNSGALGGAQIGFNVQNGMWVWGAEGDFTFINWSKGVIDTEDNLQQVKTRNLASIRARLGYAANNWLFYGTAGYGWGKAKIGTELDEGAPNAATRSKTGSGFVYGGGIEWAFAQNWTARAEYLRYDFGDTLSYPAAIVNDADTGDFFKFKSVNVFRVGLNYKFNWGGL
jgi:outer membrane immunogenic protein